jgi:hypothetical protein
MRDASSPDPGISPFHLEPTESKHMRLIDLTVHIPGQYRTLPQQPAPSRWKTIEFRIYAVFIFIIVLIMGWIPITLSSRALRWQSSASRTKPSCSDASKLPEIPLQAFSRLDVWSPSCKPAESFATVLQLSNLRTIVMPSIVDSETILFH